MLASSALQGQNRGMWRGEMWTEEKPDLDDNEQNTRLHFAPTPEDRWAYLNNQPCVSRCQKRRRRSAPLISASSAAADLQQPEAYILSQSVNRPGSPEEGVLKLGKKRCVHIQYIYAFSSSISICNVRADARASFYKCAWPHKSTCLLKFLSWVGSDIWSSNADKLLGPKALPCFHLFVSSSFSSTYSSPPQELHSVHSLERKEGIKCCNLHFHMLPVAPGRVDNWVESGDGESRIDMEKANWKKTFKKTPTSHYWMVYFFPLHSSFCLAALNHLCSWKDLPWPPIFSPSPSRRMTLLCLPQSFSLTQLLPHPYSSRMSLSLTSSL